MALSTVSAIVRPSQVEFADKMALSKSTVAGLDTKESNASFTVSNKILSEYKTIGKKIEFLQADNPNISIESKALDVLFSTYGVGMTSD